MDERIRRAIEFIRSAEISKGISIPELAGSVGLSISRFSHLFRKQTGMTPHQVHNRMRFQEAARLLADTQLSIKEISWHVGFRSVTSFSRQFKRHWTVAPSEYRLANRPGSLGAGRSE
jgi:AraC family transcriptional regulator of arabinose operon